MLDLDLEGDEALEWETIEVRNSLNVPRDEFPVLDKVYERAWEIREEEGG